MSVEKLLILAYVGTLACISVSRAEEPTPSATQELFDLSARRNKLRLELELVEKQLAKIEKEQFAGFERVADPVESQYWESISDMVLTARAVQDIKADELLLYHGPGIYRVQKLRPKLTTDGECWYFRPDRTIRKGEEFSIELIYDTRDEIELQAKGFFPLTSRARNPDRAYRTKIHIPYATR